ncbi:MAG TPA: hypothetical protein VI136_04965 [Verrucomicrobiae bacterium]
MPLCLPAIHMTATTANTQLLTPGLAQGFDRARSAAQSVVVDTLGTDHRIR